MVWLLRFDDDNDVVLCVVSLLVIRDSVKNLNVLSRKDTFRLNRFGKIDRYQLLSKPLSPRMVSGFPAP
jgi:hypothetical protein